MSDPYLNIIIGDQSVIAEKKEQTNNPIWDTTFVISEVYLYGNLQFICDNPPEIILELYDKDIIGVFR